MADRLLEDSFSSDESLTDEEGSESDTDVDAKLAQDEVFDKEFLKCYSALKKKDEKIYDQNVRFFDKNDSPSSGEATNDDKVAGITSEIGKSSAPKMTLLDLQLRATEQDDDLDQIDETGMDVNQGASKSYYEKELDEIKESIVKVSEDVDESDDDFLVVKGSDATESKTKSKATIDSLLNKITDEDGEELQHLKKVWSDPANLSEEDKYLRDYILHKRYLPTNVNNEKADGFFSKNLDELSDVEMEVEKKAPSEQKVPTRHSDEKDFDKIPRIPRNSTKTIRDMVEKQKKREKRAKKMEKEKKKRKAIVEEFPFQYAEVEPTSMTAEELLFASDEEVEHQVEERVSKKPEKPSTETDKEKRKKKKKRRGLNHKKFAKVGVAPDRLLAYGLSKSKLKKNKLL